MKLRFYFGCAVALAASTALIAPMASGEVHAQSSAKKKKKAKKSKSGGAVYYSSCKAARAAGVSHIRRGQPGYRPGLDRDNDGVACDK